MSFTDAGPQLEPMKSIGAPDKGHRCYSGNKKNNTRQNW